jgi:hypothetical protein
MRDIRRYETARFDPRQSGCRDKQAATLSRDNIAEAKLRALERRPSAVDSRESLEMTRVPDDGADRVSVGEIVEADRRELAAFLARGFDYPVAFYERLLSLLAAREPPAGYPKFGYALRRGERIVGVVLLIFTRMEEAGASFVRCHVTSWYVEPDCRPLASMFFSRGLKMKDVAYINVSAGAWTRPIIEAQGFSKYSDGQFGAPTFLAALAPQRERDVRVIDVAEAGTLACDPFERRLLEDHASYGCIAVWCVAGDEAFPFVFHRRPMKGLVSGAQLVYCRDLESFVRFARPLARFLLARGVLAMEVDANGPVEGLIGFYRAGRSPRFFKGRRPRQGDLAYTQMAMCPFVAGAHGG